MLSWLVFRVSGVDVQCAPAVWVVEHLLELLVYHLRYLVGPVDDAVVVEVDGDVTEA